MADLTKRIIFIVLYWISSTNTASSQQKVFCQVTCPVGQVCCGLYECCDEYSKFHRIRFWVLLTLVILSLLLCIFRFKRSLCRFFTYHAEDEIPLRV